MTAAAMVYVALLAAATVALWRGLATVGRGS